MGTTPIPMATPAIAPFTVTPTASTTTRLVPRATRLRRMPSSSTDATATTQDGTTEDMPTPPLSTTTRLKMLTTSSRRTLSSSIVVMATTPPGTMVSTRPLLFTTTTTRLVPRATRPRRMPSSTTDVMVTTPHGTTVSTATATPLSMIIRLALLLVKGVNHRISLMEMLILAVKVLGVMKLRRYVSHCHRDLDRRYQL